ncbi:MAG: hypothetical protein A3J83_00010 [Elusimicrobia bacterium RIFOXYA2_FULL_40_6]|nr:MAG: hypothetical protein A3J83_00010 [Elusimicrobia bacterium RIFOXYA2_FULL_40_6]
MFKKVLGLSAGLLALCFVLYGCGSREVLKPGQAKLVFAVGGGDMSYIKLLEQVCRKFEEKNPNIKIQFLPISGQAYNNKLLTMVASNTAPDVFTLDSAMVPTFVSKQAILPLDSFMEKDKSFNKNDYYPSIVDGFTWGGKLYSLTDSMSPIVIFYNKDVFDKEKIAYPKDNWTWAEFLETAKKLTQRDERGLIKRFGVVFYDTDVLYFAKAWGGNLWNKDKTKCIINSPESKAGIQFFVDMINKYKVMPGLSESVDKSDYQLFEAGMAGMLAGGRWYTVEFRKAKVRYGIAQLPKGKLKLTPMVTHAWVTASGTKYPQQSYEFIKYLCSDETVRFMMAQGDCVPPIKKIAEGDFLKKDPNFPDEDTIAYVKSMAFSYPNKEYLHTELTWSELAEVIQFKNMDQLLMGKWTVEQYLKTVEDKINELVKKSEAEKRK